MSRTLDEQSQKQFSITISAIKEIHRLLNEQRAPLHASTPFLSAMEVKSESTKASKEKHREKPETGHRQNSSGSGETEEDDHCGKFGSERFGKSTSVLSISRSVHNIKKTSVPPYTGNGAQKVWFA